MNFALLFFFSVVDPTVGVGLQKYQSEEHDHHVINEVVISGDDVDNNVTTDILTAR